MIAALIAAVGFYPAMFLIWSIPGIIIVMGVMLVEWYHGDDITLKHILASLLGGAALGWIIAVFGIGYFLEAISIVFGAIIRPFNFTIKGRKRK